MSTLVASLAQKPDITRPKWDQNTYEGRARHFLTIANPLNVFATSAQLEQSRKIVVDYKNGQIKPGLTVDELWKAKHLYDSAFHPDSGEKMFLLGRMSAQVPCNMIISGGMLTFYRNFRGVVFWHWLNQSFNAGVNYTNRSGPNAVSGQRLFVSYCCATGGALIAALGLNSLVKNSHGLAGRLVPFVAISAANAINIPMMRSLEIERGIELHSIKDDSVLAQSRTTAVLASAQVVMSRVGMALPYMVMTPVIMNAVAKTAFYGRNKWIAAPIQTLLSGLALTFSTPLCCAIFPQQTRVTITHDGPVYVEKEIRQKLCPTRESLPVTLWYNKGL